jgi:hypothetical protein
MTHKANNDPDTLIHNYFAQKIQNKDVTEPSLREREMLLKNNVII